MSMFTKKDLGLLLPDNDPGDPVSLRHTRTSEINQEHKAPLPLIDVSKRIRRYRAGQIPRYAHNKERDEFFSVMNIVNTSLSESKVVRRLVKTERLSSDDQKEKSCLSCGVSSDSESCMSNELKESDSGNEEDETFLRRQRIREKSFLMQKKETNSLASVGGEERDINQDKIQVTNLASEIYAESSSFESKTDSSEESEMDDEILKPIFVPKAARKARSNSGVKKNQSDDEKRKLERVRSRKLESRSLVAEQISLDEAVQASDSRSSTDIEMPDDTDGLDPEHEYRQWELREMKRMKRDQDQQVLAQKELDETLRRRKMTELDRYVEDQKLQKYIEKGKKKWKFMQKYYHKGAFYIDDTSIRVRDDVRKRDTSEATLDDKFNKEMLPKVLQVRNFGKAGRTKYTHLLDQDTTSKDALWTRNDQYAIRYLNIINNSYMDLNVESGETMKQSTMVLEVLQSAVKFD